MKTNMMQLNRAAACAAVLTLAAVARAQADPAAPAIRPDRQYTGTIVSADPQNHTLKAKGFFFSKAFNLGDSCKYVLLDNPAGTAADLRPGEKVRIGYQNADGVLVADQVKQLPMRHTGMVKAIDPVAHTLTLRLHGMDKTFQIANNCAVVLRDDKTGTLPDIQVGNHVTVTYETPADKLMARQIAQTSLEFTGTLTAIDLGEKTLKASAGFTSKKFNVGDNCAIVVNGRPDGRLNDLRPDEKLVLTYDDINGVNVVNRIAPAEASPNPVAATTPMPVPSY
jgi:hypothetical protein